MSNFEHLISLNTAEQSVTIRQVCESDELYTIAEKMFLKEYGTKPAILKELLFGNKTQHAFPRLLVVTYKGELIGHVITFDFFQATHISALYFKKEMRSRGYGTMLLQHVCHDPNRTYILVTEVAMSNNDHFSDCLRRNLFYYRNGFRTVPIKWRSEDYYKYDVHVKGPDQELGSLLAVLRKENEIWRTAELSLLKDPYL